MEADELEMWTRFFAVGFILLWAFLLWLAKER